MEPPDFGDVVDLIRRDDPRYDRHAYFFLRDALDHTVRAVRKAEARSSRKRQTSHVTGPELLEGIRDYALGQYGPMTQLVLSQWGIAKCGDFGEMVYQLIEYGVFSKTDTDRKEDFSEIFDFEESFVRPYLPRDRGAGRAEVANLESF